MKNRIRIERAVLDITQEALARKVNVSRQTINAIESGKYVPSTVLALKIAKTFDKTVDDIFSLEETDWR
jgi:putative transcriptional regulator